MASTMTRTRLLESLRGCRQQTLNATFSTSTRRPAGGAPSSATSSLLDSLTANTTSPTGTLPSRAPSEPSDSSNPSLFPFPTGTDRSRPNISTSPSSNNPRGADKLYDTLRNSFPAGNPAALRARDATTLAANRRTRSIEQQAARTWTTGDVYAPHDLSSVEQIRARAARQGPRASNLPRANTRKRGTRDVIDDLALDPLREYKNFAMLGEFVSEMGRIRHGRETGLRGVNQRRVARAVRRAVGIGIMPSVHRHPELMEERMLIRGNKRTR